MRDISHRKDLVSVIVPVYDVEDYLDDCVRSIVDQTYSNLEIILVDDGSPDGCGSLCDEWAQREPRITVVHQQNRGLSAARNVGFDLSSGACVVFVDSDDTVEPTYVEVLHRAITRMGVDCVLCGWLVQDTNGSEQTHSPTNKTEIVSAYELFTRMLAPKNETDRSIPVTAWSRICCRTLLEDPAMRFPEGEVYEDISIMCSVMRASGRVGLIPDVLYRKQERVGSITQTYTPEHLRDYERAHTRFVQNVKETYPVLSVYADNYLEKHLLTVCFRWERLAAESCDSESCKEALRTRELAFWRRRDLILPTEWRALLKIWLVRLSPTVALAAQTMKQKVVHPGCIQKNVVLNGMTTVANYLLGFLTVFYVARVLAPEGMGSASFASAVVGYFALLAQLGIPIYGMRLCAKTRDDADRLGQAVTDLFGLQAALTAASAALLALVTLLVPQLRDMAPLVGIYGIGLLAQSISFEWALKGLEQFRYLLIRGVGIKSIALVTTMAIVRDTGDLYRYAAITALSSVVSNAVDLLWLRRLSPHQMRRSHPIRHLRPVMTFFLMSCAVLIYSNIDTVMLGFMRTPAEVGYYQIAAKAKVALAAIGGIVWSAVLPQATALWSHGNRTEFERLAQQSLRFVCLLQLVATATFFVCAEPVVTLIAGEGYLSAVPAFRILLLALVPIGASNIIGGQVLIPAGREKRLLTAELTAAVLNLALNLALIPVFGIEGAAASTVVAEVIVGLMAYWFARRDLHVNLFPWDAKLGAFLHVANSVIGPTCYKAVGVLIPRHRAKAWCPCCDTRLLRWKRARFDERPGLYDVRRYAHTPQDVVCPVCGSIPRHRIIAWYLSARLELVRDKSVLHFAPERSLTCWFLRHGVRAITADLFNPADLKLDIQDTGLPDESYDVIVCNHVLEHVDDYNRALRELRRVLRPGGLLVCSFPVDSRYPTVYEDSTVATKAERVVHFGQHDHLRIFGADSARILCKAGFKVEVVHGADCPDVIRPVVGPADYDSADIFFCWKPSRATRPVKIVEVDEVIERG